MEILYDAALPVLALLGAFAFLATVVLVVALRSKRSVRLKWHGAMVHAPGVEIELRGVEASVGDDARE